MENLDSYLFILKKFVGNLLMPLPIILLLLLWAILFLLRGKTRWLGFLFVLAATGLLFVASYPPLSAKFCEPMEQQYAAYQPSETPADYIAVLGSSHVSADHLPITSELNPAGIIRLTEGIRTYRLNPGSKLIFTGYKARDPESYAEKIKELALALGVPEEDILAFTGPKDTAEEAQLIAENFADKQLVLVTSALHMPRAMTLFQQVGLNPTPAPTEHLAKPVRSKWLFPNARSLAQTQYWLYEQLGLAWTKLTEQAQKKTEKIQSAK
jgi:uncharacterized SAM-binding protein YcdF (DUF218 family)